MHKRGLLCFLASGYGGTFSTEKHTGRAFYETKLKEMNDFQEEINIFFENKDDVFFEAEVVAGKTVINWGDGDDLYIEGKELSAVSHFFTSKGNQKISIKGKGITYLNISRLNLSALSLINCPQLRYLDCSVNELYDLDLSACPLLEELYCNSNHIGVLNFTKIPRLIHINAAYNQLEEVDIAACTALHTLHCSYNSLKQFRYGNHPDLSILDLRHNKLEGDQLTQLSVHFSKMRRTFLLSID